jgi:hypothetical protein
VGPRACQNSVKKEKYLSPVGNRTPAVQLVALQYTDLSALTPLFHSAAPFVKSVALFLMPLSSEIELGGSREKKYL